MPLSRSIEFIRVQLRSFAFNSVYADSGGFMRGHAGPCGDLSTFKIKPLFDSFRFISGHFCPFLQVIKEIKKKKENKGKRVLDTKAPFIAFQKNSVNLSHVC